MSDEVSGSEAIEESSEIVEEGQEQESQENIVEEIKEQKKMLKKLKLKFNGKEVDEDLPFEIPEEHAEYMTRQLQMARLSQHKSQELGQFEREVSAFLQDLKTNPRKALSNPAIGIDVKQLAAEILEEEIKQSQKTPEQIEREKLEQELQALKSEREKEKQELEARELERLTEAEFERYDNLMSQALETSNLPKSPYTVKKMTEYMIQAVENGIDISPADVIPLIQKEMESDVRDLMRALPPEMVEQLLGQEIISSLRKNRVTAAKKPPVPVKSAAKDVGNKTVQKQAEVAQKKTIKDFFGI
jgi:hypothetical protein